MNNNFNPDNAVAINDSNQGSKSADTGNFMPENASPVSVDSQGSSAWDNFRQSPDPSESPLDSSPVAQDAPNQGDNPKDTPTPAPNGNNPIKADKTQPEDIPGKRKDMLPADRNLQRPPEDWLNATYHIAVGQTWNTFVRPFADKKQSGDMDQYLNDLETKHPIASIVGGTAPFIASAPFVPESLVPNLYLRTAAQFGIVGFGQGLNRAKDDPSKQIMDKASDVAKETLKQMSYGPVFAKAQALTILDRPFASALARAGVIAGGTGVLSKVYGDNITEAFKQGGLYGALGLITESPHLAGSTMGRGVIAHMNDLRAKAAVQTGWPMIDVESPEIAQQAHDAATAMAKQIKGIDQPQIASAAIKLADGTIINGTSHEDALEKIGHTKESFKEWKSLPDVNFKDDENLPQNKIVKDMKGNDVGKVTFSKSHPEEGIKVDIKEDFQGKGYGKGTVSHIFRQGIDTVTGAVGKDNKQGIDFWTGIGAKLTKTDSGNFKMSLSKEDFNKATSKENKYEAGFTIVNPDGSSKFITREESKQEPFNLPNGHSEDVKGLNESKFMPQEDPIKIVNPDTLKQIEGNEGKINLSLLPGVPEVAEILQKSHADLKDKFAPYAIGEEAKFTAENQREQLGIQAQSNDRLMAALKDAKKLLDKATNDSNLDFIDKFEAGKKQENNDLQKIADTLRYIDDEDWKALLKTGKVNADSFIENHLPRYWDLNANKAKQVAQFFTRRPWEGKKSFKKQRVFETMREGIDAGYTPLSYNPVDFVMWRHREISKFIASHNTKEALKAQGLRQFVRVGQKAPDGWIKINDRSEDVISQNDSKELVIRGSYYTQPDAAKILNNYLEPGLSGKSFLFDMYRGAGNTLNQFQLGISAFHLGFTSMDATISKFALGINKLSTGDFAGGIKEFAKAPFAPITNILQGRELLQSWYGKDNGPLTNAIADVMATAGGRAKMDTFYATGMKDSMLKSIKEGKLATAALKVPFYVVEQVARPIMEYIVPRQKLGVFMDLMKMEMERNTNMSHAQLRGVAQRAWDSVDNRMGQLVYDNLFWHRTTKDLAMASVRSLGWNLGTIREIGGGIKDITGNVNDVIHGRATKMSYRTAYVMALPIVTGLYGAIYQYLHTGQGPQEMKDYFFPKNGAIDSKGQAARISLPTYMKDIYHYTTNPVQTVLNKFSPVNNAVMEMLLNKDFYGVQIRNVDDPAMQQIADTSSFVASQFLPFGFRNQNRDTRTSTGSKIEPFIGITPAPYDINMTAAEKEAYELEKGKIPVGSRTKEAAKHSQNKAKLRSDFMADKDRAPLDAAVKDGVISEKEKKQIIKESKMTNLQRMTQHLTFEEVVHIMKKATPDERVELEKIAAKKKSGKEARGTWTGEEESLYAKSFNDEK